jgi:hypothetical protein
MVVEFRKKNDKAKQTICDGVRDHIIPHLIGKDYAFEIWDSLCKLYQSSNQNRKMVLQDRLKSIKMLDFESVTSFLGRFTELRDELVAIGEIVDTGFMVRTTLNNFTKPCGPFIRGIVALEVMPTWERLWDDFVQEETRLTSKSSGQQRITQGGEDLALWTKGKKKIDKGARQGPKGLPNHNRVAMGRREI